MGEEHTTVAVQRYLEALTDDAPTEPIVRAAFGQVPPIVSKCSALTSFTDTTHV